MTNSPIISNEERSRLAKRFLICIPFYLLVPVFYAYLFLQIGFPISWSALGLGAVGWIVALIFRTPFILLLQKYRPNQTQMLIPWLSGPTEEITRYFFILIIATTSSSAISLGQGWAAIEVFYVIVNSIVILQLLHRDDAQARKVKQQITEMGLIHHHPMIGVIERLSASAYHIGASIMIFQKPVLVFPLILLHSVLNVLASYLAKKGVIWLSELWTGIVGFGLLGISLYLL